MLGKLLKYELKATSRTFIPLYAALLLVALINNLLSNSNFDLGFSMSLMVLMGLFVALGVMTLVVLIQRFNVNLLGDEGYLMFTLPVKAYQLILSKLITTIIWSILSCMVGLLTFILLVSGFDLTFFKDLAIVIFTEFDILWESLSYAMSDSLFREGIYVILSVLAMSIVSYTGSILQIYLSLSVAQLPMFSKYRSVIAFIAFFVINVILQVIVTGAFFLFGTVITSFNTTGIVTLSLLGTLLINLVLFFTIQYILSKHLNLE